jgi:hypothetical protein
MAEKTYGPRALAAVTVVPGLIIAYSGVASAAPPHDAPNSGASHN